MEYTFVYSLKASCKCVIGLCKVHQNTDTEVILLNIENLALMTVPPRGGAGNRDTFSG